MKEGVIRAVVVLIPTYIIAWFTDKMIYVIPMLAAMSFIAAGMFDNKKDIKRLDEDSIGRKDAEIGKEDGSA